MSEDWRPAEETEKQMAEAMNKPNIHQRIAAVRADLPGGGYMQKNAFVSTGNNRGYNALTYDKLISIVRPVLVQHGVLVVPCHVSSERAERTTRNGGHMLCLSSLYDVLFISEDDPNDKFTMRVEVDANDSGDKAPPKAQTIAKRIALRSILDIETGEDEEQRTEELVSAAEQARVEAEQKAADAKARFDAAFAEHGEAVRTIANGIEEFWASGDYEKLKEAASAWCPLPEEVQRDLWLAPTKGGELTTEQRAFMKTCEFTDAYYGKRDAA